MMHTRTLLLLFFFWTTFLGYSQREVLVQGTITNEMGTPVSNASVRIGYQNTRSNSQGVFDMLITTLPAEITVTHPGFNDYTDVVPAAENGKDTLHFFVVLEGKETDLDEVTVTANRISWVYREKNTNLLDYYLSGSGLMLLCKENHTYYLRQIDSIGTTIRESVIPKRPLKLMRDCLNHLILVYADSCYELKTSGDSISLLSGVPRKKAQRMLEALPLATDRFFFQKSSGPHGAGVAYTSINRASQMNTLFYQFADEKSMRALDELAVENGMDVELSGKHVDPGYRLKNPPQTETEEQRRLLENQLLYAQLVAKPIYIPVFELNDSIIVFDHFNDIALVHDRYGNYIRSFAIHHHYFKNWEGELICNEEKTKIFAVYQYDGLVTLREINPSNGNVEHITLLEKHIYPEHIQIRETDVYYIYKHYLDNSIHFLYKQPLNAY